MTTTVLPVHRLAAREVLYRATLASGLSDWTERSIETFVDAASLALAEGSLVCLKRVGSVITYRVFKV